MPLFEVQHDTLAELPVERFAALEMYEKDDLQRLLRNDISPLGNDLLVIAEEYGHWEDARRRIDLLALDRTGRLVVIELKRTETGGHMDLQVIRYAAMVSSMSLEDVVEAYDAFCSKHRPSETVDARAELEEFLGEDEAAGEAATISTEVRIVLVSADFGREITTTVLWLNSFVGMDIRCFRLVPYRLDGRVVLDVQQVIPLSEAADYQVKVRRKEVARERARSDTRDFTRYHVIVNGNTLPDENKRNAIRVMIESLHERGVPLDEIRNLLPDRAFRVLPGQLTDRQAVIEGLSLHVGRKNLGRYFTEHALTDEANDETYVLSKMWGRDTEPTLALLSEAFPDANIGVVRADADNE